jgi:hypothetical protein
MVDLTGISWDFIMVLMGFNGICSGFNAILMGFDGSQWENLPHSHGI